MTRLFKFLFITTSLFLLSFNTFATTKQYIDLSNVEWSESEFIYDNTIKTVELKNIPTELEVSYEDNSKIEVGTYFAKAKFSYDKDVYQLKGYDAEKFESFCWSIVKGKYNTSNYIFKSSEIVYDGNPHSLYVNNVPDDVMIEYIGNGQVEPGIYEVVAKFTGNQYYAEIPDMKATLIINKREMYCDDGECRIISEFYGINPTYHLKHIEISSEEYQDVDLSNLGSFREIKMGFRLSLYDLDNNFMDISNDVIVELTLDESLLDNEILEVYEYSTSGISKINAYRSGDSISFEISSLNSDYLIIGMRETYSQGDNWKIGVIFLVVAVFIGSLLCIKRIHKKNKFK